MKTIDDAPWYEQNDWKDKFQWCKHQSVCSSDRQDDVFIQQQEEGEQMVNINSMGKLCILEVDTKYLPATLTVN